MERAWLAKVDGTGFDDCLFLAGQVWQKRVRGDERGPRKTLMCRILAGVSDM